MGDDPAAFSVELAQHLLETWRTLRPLDTELARFSRLVSDYLIWIGAPVRNPAGSLPADRAVALAEKVPRFREVLGKSFGYWQEHAPLHMLMRHEERLASKSKPGT